MESRCCYYVSYGFQYEDWVMKLHLPELVYCATESDAHREVSNRNLYAFLTSNAIYVLEKGLVERIAADDQSMYEFSRLKASVYDRLGQPLSAQDIDQLIDERRLEEIIFSQQYVVSEDDYESRETDLLSDIYEEIEIDNEAVCMPENYPVLAGKRGFLFESLWYLLERVN